MWGTRLRGISGVWEDRLDLSCLQPRTIVVVGVVFVFVLVG